MNKTLPSVDLGLRDVVLAAVCATQILKIVLQAFLFGTAE